MAEKKEMTAEEKEAKEKAEQNAYINDLKTYAYGAVAGRALIEKDMGRANVSLDKLVTEMFGKDSRLDGLLAGIYSSEEASKTASQIYANKYQSALEKTKVSNLWNFYSEQADKYIGDLKANASKEIEKFRDLEFGKIKSKYFAASEIVKSNTTNFTKEQKENAEKDMKKYEKFVLTMQTLEDAYLDKYNSGVADESRKRLFKQLYGQETKRMKKEKTKNE